MKNVNYLPVAETRTVVADAIANRRILLVQYEREEDLNVVIRKMAPFDLGLSDPGHSGALTEVAHMFCYDHYDYDNHVPKPLVHPVRIDLVTSIKANGLSFDENELADIHKKNTGYDYRTHGFNYLPDRKWFGRFYIRKKCPLDYK